jgi:hypothetical protein
MVEEPFVRRVAANHNRGIGACIKHTIVSNPAIRLLLVHIKP